MGWDEVLGQPLAVRRLRRAAAGPVPHALLLAGPPGTGKRTAAIAFARALNCQSPPTAGNYCGHCTACRKIVAGVHPDVLMVAPVGKHILIRQLVERSDEQAAPSTPVRSFVARRPAEAAWQVVVIDGAETMTTDAANTLLKTLEEPPPYTVFVVISRNLAAVLPTILSRCQTVQFPPLPTPVVVDALEQRLGLAQPAARLMAALAGGSLGQALQLAGDADVIRRREEARQIIVDLPGLEDDRLLALSEGLEKRRDEVPEVLHHVELWLRDVVVWGETANPELLLAVDAGEFLAEQSGRYSLAALVGMMAALAACRQAMDRNANLRLALDVLLLRLARAARTSLQST